MIKFFVYVLMLFSVTVMAQQTELRDPTMPQNRVTMGGESAIDLINGDFPNIRVSAIFASAQTRYAIVNGKTLSIGDGWDNIKVIAINSDSVTLSRGDVVKTFAMQSINIKQDIANEF
ncbi:hypothetical protein [Neptunicella sp.]|uniref:hypothetical protein n=1 Tax=Neptunicella sp. TaxID=2125986 RepID=UPI003F68E92B